MIGSAYLVSFAGVEAVRYIRNNPEAISSLSKKQFFAVFTTLTLLGIGFLTTPQLWFTKRDIYYWVFLILGVWILSVSLVFVTSSLWNQNPEKKRITTKLLKKQAKNFERLIPFLKDKMTIPIGISLASGRPFYIPILQALEHILICGATGMGKTSVLITMLMHSMFHKMPAIIVDPKGDLVDIDLIRKVAKMLGREDDLLIFSLSSPKSSCSYDPIKVGTPEQRKSKLMLGLNLEHHHYGALAAKYLGTLFDVLDFLGEKNPDIHRLQSFLLNQNERALLEERLNEYPESDEVNDLISKLAAIRRLSHEDLSGLTAQIEAFGLREFNGVFCPSRSKNAEIDLIDVFQNGKIAYFQLNTNAYGDLSYRFGKLLVQDISLISNIFQSGQLARKFEFASIHIDEFGPFATKTFANIQKMIRSAHMGLRLYYQGMADLRDISPQFEDQVLGNAATKIILRQDIQGDVEKWSGMAGTVDAYIQSHQTEKSVIGSLRTGMGNMHEGKKVKIDFDVFKELGKGQAVIIDKGRKIQDIIQIWDAKGPEYISKLAETMANNALPSVSGMPTSSQSNAKKSAQNGLLEISVGHANPKLVPKRTMQSPHEQRYFRSFQKTFGTKDKFGKTPEGFRNDQTT